MSKKQEERRVSFIEKLKSGKEGVVLQQLIVEKGGNRSQSSEVSGTGNITGKAILLCDGELLQFDTDNIETEMKLIIACNRKKKLLVDVISKEHVKTLDIGFESDNSMNVLFGAYLHTGIEEFLYIVNTTDKESKLSCMKLFTGEKESSELEVAYELIALGISQYYHKTIHSNDFLGGDDANGLV